MPSENCSSPHLESIERSRGHLHPIARNSRTQMGTPGLRSTSVVGLELLWGRGGGGLFSGFLRFGGRVAVIHDDLFRTRPTGRALRSGGGFGRTFQIGCYLFDVSGKFLAGIIESGGVTGQRFVFFLLSKAPATFRQ